MPSGLTSTHSEVPLSVPVTVAASVRSESVEGTVTETVTVARRGPPTNFHLLNSNLKPAATGPGASGRDNAAHPSPAPTQSAES